MIASFLVWGGLVLFFALIVTQSFLFAAYPAKYKDDSRWYAMAASQALSVIFWLRLVLTSEAKLHRLFYVWGFYIFGLVISILTVFAHVGNILHKERFFGPNVLKTTLCITPLLLLLLLNTAKDAMEYKEVVSKLCFYMAVDLFDSVEMLDIAIDEKKHNYGIPKAFGVAMIAVACFSLLLSPWQMAETDTSKRKPRKRMCIARARNIVQMFFVNFLFLIVRMVIVLKYKKDESIFIAKNSIAIILSIFEICDCTPPQTSDCENLVNSVKRISRRLRRRLKRSFGKVNQPNLLNFSLKMMRLRIRHILVNVCLSNFVLKWNTVKHRMLLRRRTWNRERTSAKV